ncbi:MAG: fructose-specific PTS transporter subunit EIIC [Staphylococcus equorum]|uniref:Fructose-specific PTS transporter subunit EIIC n=1 Tax=Staphylococcus equorum TaxID=246432 RepID=A0AAW7AEY4_9STAP|nr:fructose-specific PTS transporter subunit EIIC [Staphylococcus equorum]MDK9852076.1 fructose-specific PTS transporter subunit EIIC [Staphylococcus equorum]MDK9864681.1 fructose-specific PTS transporter subunit EIIC [Staphylococcus equorum]MDN5609851.1 fructose-specific PTS transporter subunit EIIC [Staphylococcus equorum]MDN5612738.1 fructose-specific PTS transporter subunit EIIC [Staphylococcus equorum]MDN5636746.1 fructose-specific PTS transporter subunit EIIC [Staphylococcus equorum]
MKILAITSCPNGIAHTYMAQEKLEQAGKEMGIDIKVETQGGVGAENVLTSKEIREADGIIIAADRQVDLSRFDGKLLINESVREGIHKPQELIQRIIDKDAHIHHEANATGASNQDDEEQKSGMQMIYQHLMNGVSFMVPFIVVGGLLMAIALTLGGKATPEGLVIPEDSFWKSIENIGNLAFSFMVPILAGYIAVSIADKPGLVPGMIGGAIAADGSFYGSDAGAGFLGGIVAGFIAGYIAKWIKNIKIPKAMAPIMPIIIIPIISSLIVGLIFIFLIGAPIASIFEGLTTWLKGMQGTNIVILALIIGAMIAFDMGGPVNKVAFLFGSALIAEGNYAVMGMVAVAVCTPPIGLGLATFINKRKFNKGEVEMGKASFTMGLFGITEGAIPFAAQDPLRIIPSNMIGAMIAAAIAAIGGVGDRVAHGGPIVAVLGGIDQVLWFFIAVIVGSVVTMFSVLTLRRKTPAIAGDAAHTEAGMTEQSQNDSEVTAQNSAEEKEDKQSTTDDEIEVFQQEVIEISEKKLTRDEAIEHLVVQLDKYDYITDAEKLKADVLKREMESTTAIGMNVAVPHAKSDAVKKPIVAVMNNKQGVNWDSLDGTLPKIVFLIAVPSDSSDTHLKLLQRLSRALMDDNIRQSLIDATHTEQIYDILKEI